MDVRRDLDEMQALLEAHTVVGEGWLKRPIPELKPVEPKLSDVEES